MTTRFRRVRGAVLAVAMVGVATVALVALDANLTVASLGLVMLVVLASLIGYTAGIACAVASFLALNYFFTPPLRSFRITKADDLVPLLAFALVTVVLGATVASVNALRQQAVAREREIRDARVVAVVEESRAGFLSAMTHSLRTPLASIKAAISTLRTANAGLSGSESAELLAVAYDETDRLERLVTKVLELSRIRAGALEPRFEPIDVGDLTRAAVRRLRHVASEHDVELTVDADVPIVHADAAMMGLVMVSLLENALRFAPRKTQVAVRIERTPVGVEMRVIDHGPGVPLAERNTVFEEFVRGEGKPDGTGLGLSISRAFVHAHGGRVWIEDTPGGGASVAVFLPRREST